MRRGQFASAESDSDEEREGAVQSISGFDAKRGAISNKSSSSSNKRTKNNNGVSASTSRRDNDDRPLVIAPEKNKDWKAEAARLRALKAGGKERFRPGMADEADGKPKRVLTEQELEEASRIESNVAGGLSTTSTQAPKRTVPPAIQPGDKTPLGPTDSPPSNATPSAAEPETEDQRALKALLKESSGQHDDEGQETPEIDTIYGDSQNNFWDRPQQQAMGEEDLFRADIDSRPDSASMNDYERVPVDAFGAALLRGMYESGDGKTKTRKAVEPYVPKARPSLLGIGAKELDLGGDEKDKEKQRKKNKAASMHFVPLVKSEKESSAKDDQRMLPPPVPTSRSKSSSSRRDRDLDEDGYERKKSSRRDDRESSRSSSRRHWDDEEDSYKSSRRRRYEEEEDDYDRRHSSSSSRRERGSSSRRSPSPDDNRRRRDYDRDGYSKSKSSSRSYRDDDRDREDSRGYGRSRRDGY